MDREKVFAKVKKCLALAKSSNPHEAANAMRQAQALMRQHGIDQADLLASDVSQSEIRAGAAKRPAGWEAGLVALVASAFAVRPLFMSMPRPRAGKGSWVFIGVGAAPQVAKYTLQVLLRQIKKARTDFLATSISGKVARAESVRSADLFARAWVSGVAGKVQEMACTDREVAAIDAYMIKASIHQSIELKTTCRSGEFEAKKATKSEMQAVLAGHEAARHVVLNRGVSAQCSGAPQLGMEARHG